MLFRQLVPEIRRWVRVRSYQKLRCCRAPKIHPRKRSGRRVFPVYPPGEIHQKFLKRQLKKSGVTFPGLLFLGQIDENRSPGVHRGIHVTEVPLVGRQLTVGVLIQFVNHQQKLRLGKFHVHRRNRNRVESQIPCSKPRVLPFVGHGDHIIIYHMHPAAISYSRGARGSPDSVLFQPALKIKIVVLLRPKHASERLAHHHAFVIVQIGGRNTSVEVVSLSPEPVKGCTKRLLERGFIACPAPVQLHFEDELTLRFNLYCAVRSCFRPLIARVDAVMSSFDNEAMEGVFHKRTGVRTTPNPFQICLVVGEQ
jgi:hypothetical protein